MRVYLSGPMTGYVDYNRPAFVAAATRLRATGLEVIDPAEMEENDVSGAPGAWHHYLRRDVKLLADCDAIYLLEGWEDSRGALLEAFLAFALGMICRNAKDGTVVSFFAWRLSRALLSVWFKDTKKL